MCSNFDVDPGKLPSMLGGWEQELRRLSRLWRVELSDVAVVLSGRFKTSAGSASFRTNRIAVSKALPARLRAEVLCHELAHLAAYRLVGTAEKPHGATWQRLVRKAGYTPNTKLKLQRPALQRRAPRRFLHSCLVCDFSRFAGRPMRAWRCADCCRVGLDGRLSINPVNP